MTDNKDFSTKALATLAVGIVIMVVNRDEKKPTKEDLLSHSDMSYKGIGFVIATVGGLWFLTSIINKK